MKCLGCGISSATRCEWDGKESTHVLGFAQSSSFQLLMARQSLSKSDHNWFFKPNVLQICRVLSSACSKACGILSPRSTSQCDTKKRRSCRAVRWSSQRWLRGCQWSSNFSWDSQKLGRARPSCACRQTGHGRKELESRLFGRKILHCMLFREGLGSDKPGLVPYSGSFPTFFLYIVLFLSRRSGDSSCLCTDQTYIFMMFNQIISSWSVSGPTSRLPRMCICSS